MTCFVAGEFPLLDAGIEPLPNIARARVYFRAAQGSSFYYIEMTQETGRFFGKLPRPRVEASPITYYLQATTTEFEESQTPEIEAIVVEKKEDCGDRKVAAYGPPGEVTVFSSATGAAIAPAGFAAGGAAIAAGTIALIAGGAAAAGIGVGVITNPNPTPSPTPIPTPATDPDAHADTQTDAHAHADARRQGRARLRLRASPYSQRIFVRSAFRSCLTYGRARPAGGREGNCSRGPGAHRVLPGLTARDRRSRRSNGSSSERRSRRAPSESTPSVAVWLRPRPEALPSCGSRDTARRAACLGHALGACLPSPGLFRERQAPAC